MWSRWFPYSLKQWFATGGGGMGPYPLYNTGSLINKFTHEHICFYNLFNVRGGVLKQRTIASGRRGKEMHHWPKVSATDRFYPIIAAMLRRHSFYLRT